jgi:selenocysteine lyase/cysteine desulfurase
LKSLPTFREDFIPDEPPGKIEAGTFIYENVAGLDAAITYLERLGGSLGGNLNRDSENSRRSNLVIAMNTVRAYEASLSSELLRVLKEANATIYGIGDEERLRERVPTFCFNLQKRHPARVTETLAEAGIGVRDGHMYAPRLMRRLGLDPETGVVRVSLVHYNTVEEIHRFRDLILPMSRYA